MYNNDIEIYNKVQQFKKSKKHNHFVPLVEAMERAAADYGITWGEVMEAVGRVCNKIKKRRVCK